jgi:hypothetical protein
MVKLRTKIRSPGKCGERFKVEDVVCVLSASVFCSSSQTAFDDNSNIDPVLLQESLPSLSLLSVAYVEEQVSQVAEITDEVEQRRLAQLLVVDELTGLNEEELDRFNLSEEEIKIKGRVVEALTGEYLSFDLALSLFTMILLNRI